MGKLLRCQRIQWLLGDEAKSCVENSLPEYIHTGSIHTVVHKLSITPFPGDSASRSHLLRHQAHTRCTEIHTFIHTGKNLIHKSLFKIIYQREKQFVVAHRCYPSPGESEAEGSPVILRPVWGTEWDPVSDKKWEEENSLLQKWLLFLSTFHTLHCAAPRHCFFRFSAGFFAFLVVFFVFAVFLLPHGGLLPVVLGSCLYREQVLFFNETA